MASDPHDSSGAVEHAKQAAAENAQKYAFVENELFSLVEQALAEQAKMLTPLPPPADPRNSEANRLVKWLTRHEGKLRRLIPELVQRGAGGDAADELDPASRLSDRLCNAIGKLREELLSGSVQLKSRPLGRPPRRKLASLIVYIVDHLKRYSEEELAFVAEGPDSPRLGKPPSQFAIAARILTQCGLQRLQRGADRYLPHKDDGAHYSTELVYKLYEKWAPRLHGTPAG